MDEKKKIKVDEFYYQRRNFEAVFAVSDVKCLCCSFTAICLLDRAVKYHHRSHNCTYSQYDLIPIHTFFLLLTFSCNTQYYSTTLDQLNEFYFERQHVNKMRKVLKWERKK